MRAQPHSTPNTNTHTNTYTHLHTPQQPQHTMQATPGGTPQVTGPTLSPPKTLGAVVRQARDAFRRYRQDSAAARQAQPQQPVLAPPTPQQQQQQQQPQQQQPRVPLLQGCNRLKLQLPHPVASAAVRGVPLLEQPYTLFDESDFPGGIVQRFRALRPLVEALLDGYDQQFLGMLEDPADGMGCWSIGPDTTLVGLVTNATFSNFVKLCEGGYGSRPTEPGHSLLVLNPDWTRPQDIGQLWDRKLRAAAEDVLGTPWDVLYSAYIVRTSRGKGFGLLVGSYGCGWHLWPAEEETSSSVGDTCLLWSPQQPSPEDIIAAVNEAAEAAAGNKPKRGLGALLQQWQQPRKQ